MPKRIPYEERSWRERPLTRDDGIFIFVAIVLANSALSKDGVLYAYFSALLGLS